MSEASVVVATAAILMMSLAMMSLVLRAERRFALVVPDAALVVAVYCLSLALVAAAAGKYNGSSDRRVWRNYDTRRHVEAEPPMALSTLPRETSGPWTGGESCRLVPS